jgi:hypothetical protein
MINFYMLVVTVRTALQLFELGVEVLHAVKDATAARSTGTP